MFRKLCADYLVPRDIIWDCDLSLWFGAFNNEPSEFLAYVQYVRKMKSRYLGIPSSSHDSARIQNKNHLPFGEAQSFPVGQDTPPIMPNSGVDTNRKAASGW